MSYKREGRIDSAFFRPHKGYRSIWLKLYLHTCRVNRFDESDVQNLYEEAKIMIDGYIEHNKAETHFYIKALKQKDPEFSTQWEKAHVDDEKQLLGLLSEFTKFRDSSVEERKNLVDKLYIDVGSLVRFTLEHTNWEETVVMNKLWDLFTDDELRKIEIECVQSIPPDAFLSQAKMFYESFGTDDKIWLATIQKHVLPPELFNMLVGILQGVSSEKEFDQIKGIVGF